MIKKIKIHTIIDQNGNSHRVAIVGNDFFNFLDKILTILFFCLIPFLFYINKLYINSLIFEILLLIFSVSLTVNMIKSKQQEISKEDFIKYINNLLK